MQTQRPEPKINILLVDDRQENLISLVAVLESPSYRLVRATSGREALKRLLEEEFALILLDVQMPGMDGFETAALIKKRERTKNIPIIFITATSKDEAYVFRGYDAGAVDYVFKPFEPSVLRSKVAVFAELHRKMLEIARQAELIRMNERLELERRRERVEVEGLRREQAIYQKYRDLVEGIRHGVVWVADPESMIVSCISSRPETLIGYTASQLTAENNLWLDRIHPEDRERVLGAFRRAIGDRTDLFLEYRFIKPEGEIIWLQTSGRLARKTDDTGEELRCLSVDVTHLKRAEETAKGAIQVRDEFLSIASHELKTPLTPLRLQLQTLKRMSERGLAGEALTTKVIQVVDASDRQIERLNKLVEELLDVSRIDNGKLILEREELDLRELVREIIQRFTPDLSRGGCTVRLEAPESIRGFWDRLRIEQIFINLLTNAAKYGGGHPIEVRLGCDGTRATLSVRDHGIGISKEDQERIFRRFERAVSPANFGGLGLGLFIVSQIVVAHGGQIGVQSEPGEGATFRVEIPLGMGQERSQAVSSGR